MARDGKPLHADDIVQIRDRSERESLLGRRPSAPSDTCRLAYCVFFLHGVGHLLPWNFFITAQLVSRPLSPLRCHIIPHSSSSVLPG